MSPQLAFLSSVPLGVITSRSSRHRTRAIWTSQAEGEENSNACSACGREEGRVNGCEGDGRIAGGLGAVVSWWPIKAYRPCPEYIKAKKTYRRSGQSLEEIAFGRKGQGDDLSISDRLKGK